MRRRTVDRLEAGTNAGAERGLASLGWGKAIPLRIDTPYARAVKTVLAVIGSADPEALDLAQRREVEEQLADDTEALVVFRRRM